MAGVTALREAARSAIFGAGGRGFVRFCAREDALLISDANRRSDAQVLARALADAGFACEIRDDLMLIRPTDERLLALCAAQEREIIVDWTHPLCRMQALAAHLTRETPLPLDEGGRRLLLSAARLLWQPEEKVLSGMSALRTQVAVRLREGKRSGLHETGCLLGGWLEERLRQGGNGDEA